MQLNVPGNEKVCGTPLWPRLSGRKWSTLLRMEHPVKNLWSEAVKETMINIYEDQKQLQYTCTDVEDPLFPSTGFPFWIMGTYLPKFGFFFSF